MDILPEMVLIDVLEKTFKYLEFNDLKTASLVCKTWNNVIGNQHTLMAKLPLILDSDRVEKLADSAHPALSRKYSKVVWNDLSISQGLLKVAKLYGGHVRELVMINVRVETSRQHFFNVMRNLCCLEKVVIDLEGSELASSVPVQLPFNFTHLTHVCVHRCSDDLFPFYDSPSVTSLKLDIPYRRIYCERFRRIKDFLLNKMLSSLPLKKLSFECGIYEYCRDDLDVCSLTSLEYLAFEKWSTLKNLQDVYKNLTKLKLLKFAPHEELMHHPMDLVNNLSVKILIVQPSDVSATGNLGNLVNLEPFIRNLIKLETLVLDISMSPQTTNHLATVAAISLTNLRVLEIDSFFDDTFNNAEFHSLEELHIHFMVRTNVRSIVRNCPKLRKLTIETLNDETLTEDGVVHLTQLYDLQELYIGEGLVATEKMFDDLSNCLQLKKVTLMKSAIEDDPTMIEEFTKKGPKLLLLEKPGALRIDWSLWPNESLEDDDDSLQNSDITNDIDIDDDDDDDFDDVDMAFGYDEDEDYSGDEFIGAFRPG